MIWTVLELFWTFFLIGMFNFGGGGAMISLIQTQVVTAHGWIGEGQFLDIVAIAEMTPGPIGINCATYVGYNIAGVAGSAVATLAVVLPSFLIFLILIKVFDKFHTHPVFVGVMRALRPAVVGLIAAAGIILALHIDWNGIVPDISIIKGNFPDWKAWILFGAAFLTSYFSKISPILILLAAGGLGLLLY